MAEETDYWLNTTYACGLISVDFHMRIIYTCPIYKWMVGKDFQYVMNYLKKTNKFIEIVNIGDIG